MNGMQIGVDLAKSVCEIEGVTYPGPRAGASATLPRDIRGFFAERAPARVLMEACSSAHHWGQGFQRLGYPVLLLHPSGAQ